MDLYAKGQLSFLILNCLLERDFYGLDFISEINNRSNGRINLKKPSVYSNLTRMEKQGYVSSYLQNSDLGPNRKYYSVTEKGRRFYNDLKDYFERNNIDVFRDFNDGNNVNDESKKLKNDDKNISSYSNDYLNQDNNEENSEAEDYFDFSEIDNQEEIKNNNIDKNIEENKDLEAVQKKDVNKNCNENIINNHIENYVINESIASPLNNKENETNEESKIEIKKDDAVFLSSKDVDEYNKRIYDISKDINKYKRKRSFAEDQISMVNTDSLFESNERTKASIENFKSSINVKTNGTQTNNYDFSRHMSFRFPSNSIKEENEIKLKEDDGKFITQRIDGDSIQKARKIEPPRLKILPEYNTNRDNLPAPNRDKTIDPSHKEILSRLYSRSNNDNAEIREDSLYDYNDLKSFYKSQNISFNVYKKPAEKNEHNTNKLYLFLSLFVFLLSATLSAILFIILYQTNNLNKNTDFLFILLPALFILDIVIKFYNYKKYRGWLPAQMIPQWQIWVYTIFSIGIVIGLNFILGLNGTNFNLYATSLILPTILLFVFLPIRYYLKRYILIKYWK